MAEQRVFAGAAVRKARRGAGLTQAAMAEALDISKPAISRALDRLAEFELVRRKTDPQDRRSVLVQRTPTGSAFFREIKSILRSAASAAEGGSAKAKTARGGARAAR